MLMRSAHAVARISAIALLAVLLWGLMRFFTADHRARQECQHAYAEARTAAESSAVGRRVIYGDKTQATAPLSCEAFRRAGQLE